MYGLSAGTKKSGCCREVAVRGGWTVVCTKAVKQFWSNDILVYFYLAKKGCIQDLKKRLSLSKTKVTNRGSVPSTGIKNVKTISAERECQVNFRTRESECTGRLLIMTHYKQGHVPTTVSR